MRDILECLSFLIMLSYRLKSPFYDGQRYMTVLYKLASCHGGAT